MYRRLFITGLPGVLLAGLVPASASAAGSRRVSFGAENDRYLEGRPELRRVVEEYANDHSIQECIDALDAYRKHESGPQESESEIVPMGGCVSVPKKAAIAAGWAAKIAGIELEVLSFVFSSSLNIGMGGAIGAWGLGAHWTGDQFLDWVERQSWPKKLCV